MRAERSVRATIAAAILLLAPPGAWAGPLDDIGYTRLRNELGAALPSGSMTPVAQSEAEAGTSLFYPNTTRAAFTGKAITDASGLPIVTDDTSDSDHATLVGMNFYGNTDSPAQGIDEIRVYTAIGWLGTDYLRQSTTQPPRFTNARVANHSWISTNGSQSTNILERMDYLVEIDDFIQVAGVNNRDPGEANEPFDVFGGGMNTIMVGSTFGTHSTGTNPGLSAPYIVGRTRPHLVAPGSVATSFTAPLVAGAAAMLIDAAHSRPAISNGSVSSSVGRANLTLQNGETSEVVRATLLAGADRNANFGFDAPEAWSINTAEGLNSKYGAGELDVYNSYHILAAGEHNSREAGSDKDIEMYGWDYEPGFVSTTTRTYRFEIEEGTRQFAASLAWNLDINLSAGPGGILGDNNPTMRNLNLRLRNVQSNATVQQSIGSTDVMENLYVPALGPGQYELIVSGTGIVGFTTEYGLAWRFAPSTPPTPGDVNLDGSVNLADLSILQRHFGQSSRILWTDGDMNGDGAVNRADFLVLVNNFGVGGTIAVGAELGDALALANFGPTPVPEPITAWAAIAAVCALVAIRRFRNERRLN